MNVIKKIGREYRKWRILRGFKKTEKYFDKITKDLKQKRENKK